jgi:hypothetical protein
MLNYCATWTFTNNLTYNNPCQARPHQHQPTSDALALTDPPDTYTRTDPTGFG